MNLPVRSTTRIAFFALGLGLITFALYLPSLRHSFLGYDDQQYVTENPIVRTGLTLKGLVWAFGFHASNWHPVTWLSHMLDCQLYGLKPWGHHLMNVLLHVANALLLFLVFQRMTGAVWRSGAVAALFAWHPLHVESVAWIAERKDVLSAFFWMLTIWAYLRSKVQNPKSKVFYLLSALFFALALMSKPMAVTLPFVLLLLDYWPLGRVPGSQVQAAGSAAIAQSAAPSNFQPATLSSLVIEKWPFFILTSVACILTVMAQERGFAIVSTGGLPIATRLQHAVIAYVHYLGAMFVPRHLSIYYPYETALPIGRVVLSAFLLLSITAIALKFAARRPYLLVGWLWYLGTLAPVIGVVQVGDQAWADRYSYLPLIGLFVALVWTTADLVQVSRRVKAVFVPVAVALMLLLLPLASVQLSYWRDTRTLFDHAARVIPRNHLAVAVLGSLLANEGELDQAIEKYQESLSYKPGYPEAHFFLGNAFEQQGKLNDAIIEYEKALGSRAIRDQTHILLGVALAKKGDHAAAATNYLAALKLNPESASAHNNFARLLQTQGRIDEAIEHYSAALKIDAALGPAHNNLGLLLLQKGKPADALLHLREAARLQPENAETHYNLALALGQQGNFAAAVDLFAKTITAFPDNPEAHYQFGLALNHLGRTREAMSQYASALLLKPDFPDALDRLSWILATAPEPEFRNGAEAVRMAERSRELTGRKDPGKLRTLAATYAEVSRFEEAIATVQQALKLESNPAAQASIQLMLDKFKSREPWRDVSVLP